LIILFLANTKWAFDFWFGPFIVATATTTSLCIESRFRREFDMLYLRDQRLWATLLLPSVLSLLVCLPTQGTTVFAIAPVVVPLSALAALSYRFCMRSTPEGFPWNYAITFHAGAAALIHAGLQRIGLVQPLAPLSWMEVFR
jgi:hypothetical protein